jgi:hypothetical protein
LKQRVQKLKQLGGKEVKKKSFRASSVTKKDFTDVDVNNLTAADLQTLMSFIGIQSNGDIDEKMLEQRQAMNEEFANSQSKNTLGRLSMKN